VGYGDQEYDTEYEAFYRLIAVEESAVHLWTAWCCAPECVNEHGNWTAWTYRRDETREVGLQHCRKKHVRMVWSRDRW
jgi:hypothetical protein